MMIIKNIKIIYLKILILKMSKIITIIYLLIVLELYTKYSLQTCKEKNSTKK